MHREITSLDNSGGSWLTIVAFVLVGSLLTGIVYPLATTLIGGALFAESARGSLLMRDEVVVGSSLISQPFAAPGYFIGRPSAAAHNPMGAAGSNLSPSNPSLRERIVADSAAIAARENMAPTQIPVDLLTASGSGLDPHISEAGAALQIARVAAARGMDESALRAMIAQHSEGRTLGILGETRVNVLTLNLALDAAQAATTR